MRCSVAGLQTWDTAKIKTGKKSPAPGKYIQPACFLFMDCDSLLFKPASHSNHIARLQAPSYLCIMKMESIKMIHSAFLPYIISLGRAFDHCKTYTTSNQKVTLDPIPKPKKSPMILQPEKWSQNLR